MSAALKTGADARAMRNTKYPDTFNKKVDMTKVNLPVIKKWVSDEIAKILNSDDDVVTEMIFTILEGSKMPNIKQLQNDITGFLDKDAAPFCLELWKLCLSAQDSPNGIPKELLEAKKLELIQERMAEDKAREEARRREADEREREREIARVRERERAQRGRGGRGGRGRARDRSSDRHPMSRDSRSPPRRGGPDSRGGVDSYVPGGGRHWRDDHLLRRRRSPSYRRSASRSRSPPRRRRRRNTSSPDSRSRTPPRRRSRSSDGGHYKRRSRSPPARRRRRSFSSSDNPRSPPDRRQRKPSPSRSRSPRRHPARDDSSRSRSRDAPSKHHSRDAPGDLMASRSKKNQYRLSREGSTSTAALDGKGSQRSEQPAHGGAKDEHFRVPRNPLRISKEELQRRLANARREAADNARKRRDSGLLPPA